MLQIFGCPMHFGVGVKGLTKSISFLNAQYPDLAITTIPEEERLEIDSPNRKHFQSVLATCKSIAEYSYTHILQKGDLPLFLGGDHSSAIGTVSASSTQYENMGLIWFDAHADINTDLTTATGNIHGMPVSALLGNLSKEASPLSYILTDRVKIKQENIVMIGLRDIDPPEAIILKELSIKYFTYDDVKRYGLNTCLTEAIQYLSHLDSIHLSFDIDATNPELFPGVSVPVADGFTKDEVFLSFDRFLQELPIKAIDIVEFNPMLDHHEVTSTFVYELIKHIEKRVAST